MILCLCSHAFYFFLLAVSPAATSALLVALTSLLWPSGSHPWLWLLTTSPTELQIGWHTMPQILIHQHNALPGHTPSSPLYGPYHNLSVHFPILFSFLFISFARIISCSSLQVYVFCSDCVFLATWWLVVQQQKPSPALFGCRAAWAGRASAHKASTERNNGCVLHHSNRGTLRQLPPPRSHWQTARKTDGLCIHDQFSGSPGVTLHSRGGFVSAIPW